MRRRLSAVLGLLCCVLFAAGLLRLLLWRFEAGDVYPAYSSLRADPLGAMALWEAVGGLPGRRAERFFGDTSELPEGPGTCLLLLGSTATLAATGREAGDLDRFLAAGGRVVVALAAVRHDGEAPPPGAADPARELEPDAPAKKGRNSARRQGETGSGPARAARPGRPPAAWEPTALSRHWGYSVRRGVLPGRPGEEPLEAELHGEAEPGDAQAALPARLPWPGDAALVLTDPRWRILYAAGEHPVAAWRRVGSGCLILTADSYLFSNEGLRDCPQPEFLSWVLGPSSRVVFDETHLGIQHRRGVMAMAREYRLHGLLAALGVLAALAIWRSAARPAPLLPEERAGPGPVSGRAAQSGLRDLLRRHLPPDRVLEHCVQEWARTAPLPEPALHRVLQRLQGRLAAEAAQPRTRRGLAACYNDLCHIAARKD